MAELTFSTESLDTNLIEGKLVSAEGGSTFGTYNPATEALLGTAADGTAADMDAAIGAARSAMAIRWKKACRKNGLHRETIFFGKPLTADARLRLS